MNSPGAALRSIRRLPQHSRTPRSTRKRRNAAIRKWLSAALWRRQQIICWITSLLLASGGSATAHRPEGSPPGQVLRLEAQRNQNSSRPTSTAAKSPSIRQAPSGLPESAPDLVLNREGERKADALAAFAEGVAAEDHGDTERALEAYRRSLALDPGNTELAVKVGFELVRRDQIPEGIDVLKDAEKAAPKSALPPLCLAQIYGKFLKKPQLAERYAQKALTLEPENFTPYLSLFDLYATSGQQRKAEAILARAAKVNTTSAEFWLQLAEIRARLAMGSQSGANPDPEALSRANAVLEKAREYVGDDAVALAKLGDLHELTRQPAAAIPFYRKALESKGFDANERVSVKDKLARLLLAQGQREEAISVLESIVREAPTRYETYELLGELYDASNQWARAVASYQQALLVDATKPENFLRIADLQHRQKKHDDAVATLSEARQRFPGLPRLSYALAVALSQAGKHQEALSMFALTRKEAENADHTLLDGRFYFNYGIAAEQAGHLEQATELLRKSIQIDPSHAAEAYNFLGYMWADRNTNLPEAKTLIERALSLDPTNGAYLDSLGWCYFRMGEYKMALEYLLKAADHLEPPDPVVFDHLGDTYLALGQTEEALLQWNRALSLEPGDSKITAKVEAAMKAGASAAAAPPSPTPTPPPPVESEAGR